MKRFKKSKKLIALFLSVSMLTVMVEAIEAPEDAAPISDTYALEALPQNVRSVLQEKEQIVSVQRGDELFSITTNNADGTKTATVFAIPVKYENENGEIELIDTAMVSNGILENIFQGYQYRNKANSFTAEFSTDVKKGVRMTTEDGSITMAPVTATASLMSANAASMTVAAAVEEAVENAEMNDAFVYENVFGSGTRIKYYNTLNGIKEDIILDQNIGKNRFDFEINTNGDIPMLTEDAAMIFVYDKDDPTEMKYRFGSLYAYDSYTGEASESGFRHLTEECYYELTDLGNSKYRVTVVVPAEWLNHPELVYPVTIDPTVEDYSVDNSAVNVDDTYVRESEPTKNYYLETRLRIGNYNGADYTDGKCHTFIRFTNMPSLTEVTVTEATLTMHLLSGQTTAQPARTWRVTTPWTGSTLTWNNRPANSESSWATLPTALSYYSFQVEGIVNAWYSGASNYGFLINYVDSTADDLNSLYSSDCGISNKMPTLVMTYTTDHKPIANGTYFIRNKKSNLYLDACNSGGSGTNVGQYTFNGGLNQQWVVTYVRAGYYRISPAYNTGLSLEVENGGGSNGTNIRVATSATISTQRWKIFSSPYDTYRLLSKCSHDTRTLAVENASTASGANVIQYEFNGTKNDQWVFEKSNLQENSVPPGCSAIVINGQVYMNYTNAINQMLNDNVSECISHRLMTSGEFALETLTDLVIFAPITSLVFNSFEYLAYQATAFYWFFNQVNHKAVWDIKEETSWKEEMPGIPYLGDSGKFYYNGALMTVADLGNYMYGYLGTAMRIGQDMLLWGGGVAHVKNTYYKNDGLLEGYTKACFDSRTLVYPYGDLPEDTVMIIQGINAFNLLNPNYVIAANFAPDKAIAEFNSFVSKFVDLFRVCPL